MDPFSSYPFLHELLKGFPLRQKKTLALIIAAITETGQARSFAIATTLCRWLGTRLDSAVNRFYRLLRNHRVNMLDFSAAWIRLLARPHTGHLLIAIDWTEWHHDLRMLVAAAVFDKRATPVLGYACTKMVTRGSQNQRENSFLTNLADTLRKANASATILCDRGFRRVSWIEQLIKMRLGFVVRLMDDVTIHIDGVARRLRDIELERDKAHDFGIVPLRADRRCEVRVVAYWAKGAKEPWWLATSETSAKMAVRLYDRRMTVEEQFRDVKGSRFGAKLKWTHFRSPEALLRCLLLLAVALLVWATIGHHAAQRRPSLRMVSKSKGPRQSYVTIGVRECAAGCGPRITRHRLRSFAKPPLLRPLRKSGLGAAK